MTNCTIQRVYDGQLLEMSGCVCPCCSELREDNERLKDDKTDLLKRIHSLETFIDGIRERLCGDYCDTVEYAESARQIDSYYDAFTEEHEFMSMEELEEASE